MRVAIPETQEEFDRLHKTCFGCGYFFDVNSVHMLRPYQDRLLAEAGVEHVLCKTCALLFYKNDATVVRFILTCIALAIANERSTMKDEPPNTATQSGMLKSLFTYHRPTEETIPKYDAINLAALAFAIAIDAHCPPSADRTAAVRLVQQARMTANQSIANGGASYS